MSGQKKLPKAMPQRLAATITEARVLLREIRETFLLDTSPSVKAGERGKP